MLKPCGQMESLNEIIKIRRTVGQEENSGYQQHFTLANRGKRMDHGT